jgi:polygalacturonase
MIVTRRNFVTGCAAGAFLPTTSCRAAAAGTQVTPETFGAIGDGVADDYDAFQRMAAVVSTTGGGSITLRPGRTYFLNRYMKPNNGIADVIFRGCSGLTIDGNGASISTKGDFFRDARTTRGLAGLRFEDCSNVQIRDIQLIGNVQRMTRAPAVAEAVTHGLVFGGCSDVTIDGVTARHFASDGLYIRESMVGNAPHRASRRFTVRNSRFLHNARQGLSVIQLRDATFDGCEFSYTGYVDAQSNAGPYGHHSPSAGVDIEPNATPYTPRPVDVLTGNITLRNCRMIGNLGGALLAGQVHGTEATIENIIVEACTIQASAASQSRYGLIFDVPGGAITGCTIDMVDKNAFIGWYPQSSANPRFSGNTVSGTSRPILIVRRTRGSPVIEGNRFVRSGGLVRGASGAQLLQVNNPNARVRDNQVLTE